MGRAGVKTVKASIKFSSHIPSAGGALWCPRLYSGGPSPTSFFQTRKAWAFRPVGEVIDASREPWPWLGGPLLLDRVSACSPEINIYMYS